MFVNALTSVN